MIDLAFLSSFGGNLAALGVAAGTYMVYRLLRRFRCSSHTKCCDIELVKPETERGMSGPRFADLLKALRDKQDNYAEGSDPWRANAVPLDNARALKGRPGDEGSPV